MRSGGVNHVKDGRFASTMKHHKPRKGRNTRKVLLGLLPAALDRIYRIFCGVERGLCLGLRYIYIRVR